MRKIFLTIVIILTTLILSSVSFGVVSEDINVYVRQDVLMQKWRLYLSGFTAKWTDNSQK
ncbi:MAG: hypothetical protein IJM82_09995 [Synergistaceae bacterium]|nr:hypothetical protein [Synergistaceae bacterium]